MQATPPASSGLHPSLSSNEEYPIAIAHPPWTLTGDFYTLCYRVSASQAANFPSMAFSPLEEGSRFGDAAYSRPVGGLAMIQIIRYHQSPVGPYDELAIIPGKFEWSREISDTERITSQDYKISRIYVSQKHTCYNGRASKHQFPILTSPRNIAPPLRNIHLHDSFEHPRILTKSRKSDWNIPKHLARFEWSEAPDRSVTVQVYPHDTLASEDETKPSRTAFFQATFKSIPFTPAFPFSTEWLKYLGMSTRAVHPPLPEGQGSQGELPGTEHWQMISPIISGKKSELITVDLSQRNKDGTITESENFWPGLGRWHVGIKMINGQMVIGIPDDTW